MKSVYNKTTGWKVANYLWGHLGLKIWS